MKYAVVLPNNTVENVIEAPEGFSIPGRTLVLATGTVSAGWTWNGTTFLPPSTEHRLVPLATVVTRIIAYGHLATVQAALASDETLRARLSRVQEGIYSDDVDARAFLTAVGADPDVILA